MENQYKLITLGSFGVGKTCILMKATEQGFKFPENYMCTIGVDYKIKHHEFNGKILKLTIWDTAGQERFYSVNRFYFSGCQGVILVYDITSLESFEKIPSYIEDFKQHASNECAFILVGNKKDSKDRKVMYEDGEALALSHSIPFVECSALSGENINSIFDMILEQLSAKEKYDENYRKSFAIDVVRKPKKCCF